MSDPLKLKAIPPKSIMLLEISSGTNQMKLVADFLKLKTGNKGIYVSSNRPACDLIERLLCHDFDLRRPLERGEVRVVDLVSRSVGATEVKGGVYVSSPSELSAAEMAVEKAVEEIRGEAGKTWLLLDSVSTLLVYNSSGALLQFLHFLIGRLRVLQSDGAIMTCEGSVEEKILATIRQFCDITIKL